MSSVKQIDNWFTACKPEPTMRDLSVQMAVLIEEFKELMETWLADSAYGDAARTDLIDLLHHIEGELKHGSMNIAMLSRKPALDALCDLPVTCIGVANFAGMDIAGALKEVADSNDSKLVDGKPIFDENGKMAKGPGYREPNLEPFI